MNPDGEAARLFPFFKDIKYGIFTSKEINQLKVLGGASDGT